MQIITRAQWGARYQDGYASRRVGDLRRYFHHTATRQIAPDATLAYEISQIRAVEAIGQQRFGSGMSYGFLIVPSGRAFEGTSIDRYGAHSGSGRNSSGAALCWVGNYDLFAPTPAMIATTAELLVHGIHAGWWTAAKITEAHRDFKATACPGRHAYAAISEIHAAAARLLETASRGGDTERPPLTWRPARLPELINARLHLAGFPTAGRLSDYDRAAVAAYQGAQLHFSLLPDGLWGDVTEAHFGWVVELQLALNRIGGRTNVDGSLQAHTAYTVGRAQSALGLVPDEVPGPITCKALGIREHP